MPSKLLTIACEIRLRILEYAVTLKPIVICRKSEDHFEATNEMRWVPGKYEDMLPMPRGLEGNPHLSLYLVCSQITTEVKAMKLPLLQLEMCSELCVGRYIRTWPSTASHVASVEFTFRDILELGDNAEDQMMKDLCWFAAPHKLRVEIVEMRCSEVLGMFVKCDGTAVSRPASDSGGIHSTRQVASRRHTRRI